MHKHEIIIYWSNEDKSLHPGCAGTAGLHDTWQNLGGGVGQRQGGHGPMDRDCEGVMSSHPRAEGSAPPVRLNRAGTEPTAALGDP